jgi:hypothetical protein
MQIEADDRRRRFSLNVELVGLDREDSEQIAMRMVALRRTWTAIARCAEIGACLQAPIGSLPPLLPAPSGSSLTSAGIFTITPRNLTPSARLGHRG